MVIIEDQYEGAGRLGDFVDQERDELTRRWSCGHAKRSGGIRAHRGIDGANGRDHIFEKNENVIVCSVERNPGGGAPGLRLPLADQSRFPVTRRRDDEGELALDPTIDLAHQSVTDHTIACRTRSAKFGEEQPTMGGTPVLTADSDVMIHCYPTVRVAMGAVRAFELLPTTYRRSPSARG